MDEERDRDRVFADASRPAGDFAFDRDVAEVFDDMLLRSVPFYREQQEMIREMACRFWVPGTRVYDLGCSTGTTLIGLAPALGEEAELVGIDSSAPMVERARRNVAAQGLDDRIEIVVADLNRGLDDVGLENASVVTMAWTLQFVRPLRRDGLVRRIYDGMVEDGILLVTEKVLTDDSATNRFFIDLYYDFKRRNDYTDTEIARKREALENVLVPYRVDENLQLLRRNGFEIVETFFRWYNFAGFLAVKKPPLRCR